MQGVNSNSDMLLDVSNYLQFVPQTAECQTRFGTVLLGIHQQQRAPQQRIIVIQDSH